LKWQLLVGFTLGEALSVGFLSSFYKFQSVISAMLATALAATSISVYTATQRNPKYDLSQWGAGLSSCGMIFVAYGLLSLLQMVGVLPAGFLPYNETLYGLCGACLFSFYLAHHTKLIVSGKNTKYQLNEKDYVFGASKYIIF
jgi:FtsH-binding integral membrane protein